MQFATLVSMIAIAAIAFAISYRNRLREAEKDKEFWYQLAVMRGKQIDTWVELYGFLGR